jgi:hypothetical protein
MDAGNASDIESTPLRHVERQMPLYLRLLIWCKLITVQSFDSDVV